MKKIEDHLRDLQDTTKHTNIHVRGVLEGDRKQGIEKLFGETIMENFLNLVKEIDKQAQEVQRVPNKMNPKRPTPRPIIKMPKVENQDGGVGRHTAPPRTTRTDRESNGKEVRHQGNKK